MDLNRISQLANYPKVCAQCEKHLPDSARFCPRCGSGNVVDRKETLKLRFCSHCRSEPIMADARTFFCPACGSKLSDYVAGGADGSAAAAAASDSTKKTPVFLPAASFLCLFLRVFVVEHDASPGAGAIAYLQFQSILPGAGGAGSIQGFCYNRPGEPDGQQAFDCG